MCDFSCSYALRTAIDNDDLGFTLKERRSSRHPAVKVTDTDFADDIALLSNSLVDAQLLLNRVEQAAKEVGLHINATKTEFMTYNVDGVLNTLDNKQLKNVDDFQYLGSWIDRSSRDIEIRKAKAWSALSKMESIWKSDLPRNIKVEFFRATVESVLLYGGETWTLTKSLEQRLDGCYTRLLRAALNISWRQHTTNKELYGDLPRVSTTLRERRLRFSGHCWRSKAEVIPKLLFWQPTQGR